MGSAHLRNGGTRLPISKGMIWSWRTLTSCLRFRQQHRVPSTFKECNMQLALACCTPQNQQRSQRKAVHRAPRGISNWMHFNANKMQPPQSISHWEGQKQAQEQNECGIAAWACAKTNATRMVVQFVKMSQRGCSSTRWYTANTSIVRVNLYYSV